MVRRILYPVSLRADPEGTESFARSLVALIQLKIRQRHVLTRQIDDAVSELEELGVFPGVIEKILAEQDPFAQEPQKRPKLAFADADWEDDDGAP